MSLWLKQELSEALKPARINATSSFTGVGGISIDSRSIRQGDLFVALAGDPGPRFHGGGGNGRDGHEFLQAAMDRGAEALLVSRPAPANITSFEVADTLDSLWQLGTYARQRTPAGIVAITGSSGKTTAKQWLSDILATQGKTHASEGSLNNHWGVPLSLARMPRESQFGVFEIGTNHVGEIEPLARMVKPNVALLLNVLPAHIGNFGSISVLRKEKLSIGKGLLPGGKLIVPLELVPHCDPDLELISFGLDPSADVFATIEQTSAGSWVKASVRGLSVDFTLQEAGEHRVLTALAVLAVAFELGVDPGLAAARLKAVTSPVGRGNREIVGEVTVIDDSYNANPASMTYAIKALADEPGRRIALLGEILELGEFGPQAHRDVRAAAEKLDGSITVGEGFREFPGSLGHLPDPASVSPEAIARLLSPGDKILVKGSNRVFWVHQFVQRLKAVLTERTSASHPVPR